ncbi:MAG: 4-hydroxy-tetrahydrodipicolinate synthase [bacterium]
MPENNLQNRLKGSITALITPFKGGKIDREAFCQLIERQITAGTHGLVPMGTTGESPTLNMEEHLEVVRICVEVTQGRVPVIAGAGSNNTADAIYLAKEIEKIGADGLLTVTGYYNKPPQRGILEHFTAVHEAVTIGIILYNIPGRTCSNIEGDTLAQLSQLPRVIGVKDATGDLARVASQRLECKDDFIQLSGEDATAIGFNAMGGRGCISVTSNIAPRECADLQNACLEGRWADALALQDKLTPLTLALFSDASPAPAKYALARMGLIEEELRLPLVQAKASTRAAIDEALTNLGLL